MEIPRYNQSVGTGDMPGVRVPGGYTARDFGLLSAGQIQQSGAIMQDISAKMDMASVINAESDLKNKTTEFLYKDLFQRKGNAAATADKDFDSFYRSAASEASAGLSGRAKGLMQQRAVQQRAELFPRVQSHMMQQAEIATQDALSGLAYSSALAFSQPGAYMDTNAAEKMRLDILGATGAAMRGRDPMAVRAKADEIWQQSMVASLKTLQQQDDLDGVLKWKERYDKKVDPRLTAPVWGWAKNKQDQNTIITDAERIKGMFANPEEALSYIRNTGVRSEGNISIDAIKTEASKYKGLTYEMDNEPGHMDCSLFTQKVYGALGLQLPRTADYQYKQFSDKGQILTDKAQLKPGDIVFFKNTYQDETVDNNGITHVGIYQGDGKVLQSGRQSGVGGVVPLDESHYAGFAHTGVGGGGGGGADPVQQKKLEREVLALYDRDEVLKNRNERKSLDDLRDELALAKGDAVSQLAVIKKYEGILPPRITVPLADGVTKEVNKSIEQNMMYQLDVAELNGTLTAGDLQKAAPYLSAENQIKYSLKLAAGRAKENDKLGLDADNRIKQELDTAFVLESGNKEMSEQKQSALLFVRDQLDRENIKGAARYARGMEILKENHMTTYGKVNTEPVKAYIQRGAENSLQRADMVKNYGAEIVRLAVLGHPKLTDDLKNNVNYYSMLNKFLYDIGEKIQSGDSKAQEALDLLVSRGSAINAQSYSTAYSIVSRRK